MFDKFWNNYPARNRRKLGKKMSQEAFNRLAEEDQEACVLAAKHYAKACQPKADEFVPEPRDPIRFLKKDWWRDWVEGDAAVCDFRMTPACESAVVEGTSTCEFHTAYREKLAKLRQA